MKNVKIRLAQINTVVGDIQHNVDLIKRAIKSSLETDIFVFPELSITGYPPQDLLLDKRFISKVENGLSEIIDYLEDQILIIGLPRYSDKGKLLNSAAVIQNKRILGYCDKSLLPTYDVFDETRYFTPSEHISPFKVIINGSELSIGVQICEDLWDEEYPLKVTDTLIKKGAEMIINISASPFRKNILDKRIELCRDRLIDLKYYFIYCNLVGGQDELVFDGRSFALDKNGDIRALGKSFSEDMVDFDLNSQSLSRISIPVISESEEIYSALVLGVRDYFKKSGFSKAVIGLSGGIDSSLTACIASDALGNKNVVGISMPSQFSSDHSKEDASHLARNLGIEFQSIAIADIFENMIDSMGVFFKDTPSCIAEENLQARIRGNILMSISNKLGALVLNTGNKTELALGYCTMYGDMCGALGVISDINKLQVYELSKWINDSNSKVIIPENSIVKTPSAELKEEQYDPFDYNIVSPMVDHIVNDLFDSKDLLKMGYAPEIISQIINRIHISEHKRRQAPPGIKVSQKAFGVGRRYPINNQYRGQH